MTISKKGVAIGDPLELIKLSYFLNKEKFISGFDKVSIKVGSELDLNGLAEIVKNKIDVGGKIKDKSGNVIMFDTMRILDSIKYSKEEKDAVLNNTSLFTE